MAYCDVLPAQETAVSYLNRIGNLHDGRIVTLGHSKGGNLAVYASAFCESEVRGRITDVTSLDGPGFNERVMSSDEYRKISRKVRTFIPKASIVGTLFSRMGEFSIIESKGAGLMQHIPYNWEIMAADFVVAAKRDGTGQLVEGAIAEWINSMTADERRTFIDTAWSVLSSADIDEFTELFESGNYRTVQKNYKKLSEEQHKLIGEAMTKLRDSAKSSLRELLKEARKK